MNTNLPLCWQCQTFIQHFNSILPASLIIGKGWIKFPFMFVLTHIQERSQRHLCVCHKLFITCLLSFVLLGWRYVCNYYSLLHVRVSHHASIKQSERKRARCYLRVKKEREGGGKKYEIELMCCWFIWKHKTLGDTFDDSWKFIENRSVALMLIWVSLLTEALSPSGLCSL